MWNRQIEDMLENGTIDIGISLLPIHNDALYTKKLFSEQLYCIVNSSHRLAGSDVLRFDDIIHEQIAMADENFNTYNAFMARCQEQGLYSWLREFQGKPEVRLEARFPGSSQAHLSEDGFKIRD